MAILFYEFLSLPHCVSPQRRLIFMVQDVFIHLCKREKNEKTTKIYIFISCLGLLEIKEIQQQWPFSLAQLQPSARYCRKKRIPNGFKIYFFVWNVSKDLYCNNRAPDETATAQFGIDCPSAGKQWHSQQHSLLERLYSFSAKKHWTFFRPCGSENLVMNSE